MVSAFRGAIDFFDKLGVYDVVLPFLLVFSITFAIFEKTRILGSEGKDNKDSRKNLNAMVSFVIALFVVGSSRLVSIINQGLAQVALILVILVAFLLLIGTVFSAQGEDPTKLLTGGWQTFGIIIIGISILAIFLHQVGWLDSIIRYLTSYWDSAVVGSVVLVGLMIWFVIYITKGPTASAPPAGGTH